MDCPEFLCKEQIEQIQRLRALVAESHYLGRIVELSIENIDLRRITFSVEEKDALPPEQVARAERYKRDNPIT